MVAFLLRRLTPATLCAAALAAAAQTPPAPARRPDPLDAGASVPAAEYRSAFGRQGPATEGKAIPWREANDTAARIGGWRAYAREAQQPEPAPSTPAAAPASSDPKSLPVPPRHSGHATP